MHVNLPGKPETAFSERRERTSPCIVTYTRIRACTVLGLIGVLGGILACILG